MFGKIIGRCINSSIGKAMAIAQAALIASLLFASQGAMAAGDTKQGVKVADKQPEVRVGELGFKVASLRISRERGKSVATITLAITNNGKESLALNYKSRSAILVNEHGYSWSGDDISGLAIETNNSASVDYIVDPGGQISATFQLQTGLNDNQSTGSSFNLQAVFSSFKDMGEGRLKKIRSYPVSFLGLKQSAMPEAASQDVQDNPNQNSPSDVMSGGGANQTAKTPDQDKADQQSGVRVGELGFKVDSLRISRQRYGTSIASISLTITNNGKEPLALNYKSGSASLVNEHGSSWEQRQSEDGINGLATETNNKASLDYIVEPGSQISATLKLRANLNDNQSTGNSFNLQAVFSTFKDLGEGRLKKIRSYPVSFLGLKQSSITEATSQEVQGGANKIDNDLKKALGRIFGK